MINLKDRKIKKALIYEWYETYSGAEREIEQIIDIFPDIDLYAICDFLPKNKRDFLKNKKVKTSFIQNIPFSKYFFRSFLPLMPFAIEQFDLNEYDLVISVSHAVAKGVITGPDQCHISYVNTPIRYAWELKNEYLNNNGFRNIIKSYLVKWMLHKLRQWDITSSSNVDFFLGNSNFICKRIKKYYQRNADTLYPPVDTSSFELKTKKEDFYITASRLVPYKRIDLIVSAFLKVPEKQLYVIGDGPEMKKISDIVKKNHANNIHILGYKNKKTLIDYMQRAKAFIFAAKEDFGIVPLEAQACGTPVIAYGKGGSLETIKNIDLNSNPTGVLFDEQTESSLLDAIINLEENYDLFLPKNCRENANRFCINQFRKDFSEIINNKYTEFLKQIY